jgi:hypothetical protein
MSADFEHGCQIGSKGCTHHFGLRFSLELTSRLFFSIPETLLFSGVFFLLFFTIPQFPRTARENKEFPGQQKISI